MNTLTFEAVTYDGEIETDDRLGRLLVDTGVSILDNDVIVVSSKAVAKAEGRVVRVEDWAELVQNEAKRVLRRRGELVITETHHGFICANAGIDRSNVEPGNAVLLPKDPDRSAHVLRNEIRAFAKVEVGVIVSDTFGRAWRNGVTDIAIGCAGIKPLLDLRGTTDANGNTLQATQLCIADEIAGAASLVMGKTKGAPFAIVRGVDSEVFGEGSVRADVVRHTNQDLFR